MPASRVDQFEGVNRLAAAPIALIFTAWAFLILAAVVVGNGRSILICVLGPVVVFAGVAPFEDWSDPNFFQIGACLAIGCLVGVVVALGDLALHRLQSSLHNK